MRDIKNFLIDEAGFTGAEKAIITCVALGIILLVAAKIKQGSSDGADKASKALSSQSSGNNVPF